MGQPPLVSVIVPAYNAAAWIHQTIASVLEQTYSAVEVLVIDDASKDATVKMLSDIGPRIRILENKTNLGLSASRNRAIAAAKGDYIALLDHDDLWAPEKLAMQMALFERQPELGLVYSDARYQTSEGRSWRSFVASPPYRGDVFIPLLQENFVPCLTAVVPAKVLHDVGPFRTDLRILEDHDMFLRIARRHSLDYVDQPLATYRIHDQNFTRRRDVYYAEKIRLQSLYATEFPLEGEIALQRLGLGAALMQERHLVAGAQSLAKGVWGAFSHTSRFARAAYNTWHRKKRVSA
jgi:glycosyltransferase involved in cell wall biosynthesis